MEKSSNTFLHAQNLWVIWNLLVFLSLLVVTVIGGFGWMLISQGLGYVYLPDDLDFLLPVPLSLLIGCLLAGLVQWLAFRGRIKYSYLWILATALGWFFAAISLFIFTFTREGVFPPWISLSSIQWNLLAGATAGMVIGLLQWLVLWRQVRGAGWWILGSILGWASVGCAFYLTSLTENDSFSVLGFVAMGMITGVAYAYLFSQPDDKRLVSRIGIKRKR